MKKIIFSLFFGALCAAHMACGASQKVKIDDRGVLLLAFDDRNFTFWEKALPLFAKYNAHATFFVSGNFDEKSVASAKKLQDAGHSIGLHGIAHRNVPDVFAEGGFDAWWKSEVEAAKKAADAAGLKIQSFAYPNNCNTPETDEALLKHFSRLRTGIPKCRPYRPTPEQIKEFKPLATDDRLFFPSSDLTKHRVMGGVILGDVYQTDIEDTLNCVRRAGAKKEVLLFTSHAIVGNEGFSNIHMKEIWLERILAEAQKANVRVIGFNELP